jgi:hypothetical protein
VCTPGGILPLARRGDDLRSVLPRRHRTLLDPHASATAFLLARAVGRLDAAELAPIVDAWHTLGDESGAPLVTDEGCDVRVGHTRVKEDVRVALLAWLPPAPGELAVLEGGLLAEAPADAVALLLRPPLIWSLHEALRAGRSVSGLDGFEPARFAVLERAALDGVRPCHLHRVRRAAERIVTELPVERLPIASSTVTRGCAVIAADDGVCGEIAARQLARYAVSEVAASRRQSYTC